MTRCDVPVARVRQILGEAAGCFTSTLPDDGYWLTCSQILDEPDLWIRTIYDLADFYGAQARHQAVALSFQRLCHRLVGVAAGVWLVSGRCVNTDPSNVRLGFNPTGCVAVDFNDISETSVIIPQRSAEMLFDGFLEPLAAATRSQIRSSLANMRDCMAASIALAAEYAGRWQEISVIRERLAVFLDPRPWLKRSGVYRVYDGPRGPRLRYVRKGCCQIYALAKKGYCCWCSHLDPIAQDESIRRSVAQEADDPIWFLRV